MKTRGFLPWIALALVLLGVAVVAGTSPGRDDTPFAPNANGPRGAKALVVLLEELGAEVAVTAGAPDDRAATAVLLDDRLDGDDLDRLGAWVAGGGVLVVGDPTSPLARVGEPLPCPAALDGTDTLSLGPGSSAEVDRGTDCFDGFVRAGALGGGTVVSVGDGSLFTNRFLANADNAVLAASLLAPTGTERVAFLEGPAGSGDEALVDLIGPRVAQALGQAGIAFAVYALWRARRLGRVVPEGQPVAVAGSELVAAVGRLLGGRARPGEAAARIRDVLRRDLELRLGLPPDTPIDTLAAAVTGRTGLDAGRVAAALETRPVTTDDELVAVVADLDRIRSAALGPAPVPGGAP